MRIRLAALASLSAATLMCAIACGGKKPPVAPEPPVTETLPDAGDTDTVDAAPRSLFERLGGKDGIAQVVDAFIKNVQADSRVSRPFAKVKGEHMKRFHDMLVDQLCELTGGPCTYQGKDMKSAHKGMHVTNKQFDASVEDLQAAMSELKVPDQEQTELVNQLSQMREDIVGARR
jgi:hemoglobin